MDTAGALASMMTGSGAAVFGLFAEEAAARQAAQNAQPLAAKVFVAQPTAEGPSVITAA